MSWFTIVPPGTFEADDYKAGRMPPGCVLSKDARRVLGLPSIENVRHLLGKDGRAYINPKDFESLGGDLYTVLPAEDE